MELYCYYYQLFSCLVTFAGVDSSFSLLSFLTFLTLMMLPEIDEIFIILKIDYHTIKDNCIIY